MGNSLKTNRYDGSDVRKILTGMVLDQTVCSRISSNWTPEGLFDSNWANVVGGIVVNHFRKYQHPPNGQMQSLFEDWAKSTPASDEIIKTIERFLQSISDEEHQNTSEYLIDLSGQYFNKVRIEQEVQAAGQELKSWKVDDALERLNRLRKVNLGVGSFIEPVDDLDFWLRIFNNEVRVKPLVKYQEDLGWFFGDCFQRGRLYSFMAPDKSGKTAWLIDFAYRAIRSRNRVAYFDVGDALEVDFGSLLGCRVTGLPLIESEIALPYGWKDDEAQIEMFKRSPPDGFECFQAIRRISKRKSPFRVSIHPSSSCSALDIDGTLADWDREDWRPDVVIIDYADILAPPRGFRDTIDQIDETWKTLRRISQQRHCLVITATQSSSLAYGKEDGLLGKRHFSGRKTKLAHVNGMIGINVTDAEREKGMARINKFAWRHGKHSEREFVRVAGCHDICNPAVISKR